MTDKLMVYLDEDMHEDLRALAFRKKTTMAYPRAIVDTMSVVIFLTPPWK